MIDYKLKEAKGFTEGSATLFEIIKLLRSPEGCPWDRVQTNKTATQSLIDETYEYLDGVIANDTAIEREELGDILINVYMNLYIHEENGDFNTEDVFNEVCSKLIRRHPHVFSDQTAANSGEVLTLWNSVKENVEGKKLTKESIFGHIPKSLPPLETSYEIQKKLAKVGFDWSDTQGIVEKIEEELDEVKEALREKDVSHTEEEIGDLIFSVVNLARFLKIRPNVSVRRTNEKVIARFERVFAIAEERGIPLDKEHSAEMNEIWDEIKSLEHRAQ